VAHAGNKRRKEVGWGMELSKKSALSSEGNETEATARVDWAKNSASGQRGVGKKLVRVQGEQRRLGSRESPHPFRVKEILWGLNGVGKEAIGESRGTIIAENPFRKTWLA